MNINHQSKLRLLDLRLLRILMLCFALGACQSEQNTEEVDRTASLLPPLPTIQTVGLIEGVKIQFESLQNSLLESPLDGHNNRKYAELLHAYSLYQPAAVMYERCQLLRPNDLECRYLSALTYKELGNLEKAIEELKLLLARKPNFPRASVVLANTYKDLGLLDQAVPLYQQAIEKRADNFEAQFGLAQAHISLGQFSKAQEPLNYLHSQGRNFAAVHTQLAILARQRKDMEASTFHTAAAKRYSANKIPFNDVHLWAVQDLQKGDSRYLREATAAFNRGKLKQAAELYEQALSINPQNTSAHASLVGIYGRLGQLSLAQSHFDKSIVVNPNDMLPYMNLGTVHMQRGAFKEARELYASILEKDAEHAEAITLKAYCEQLLGNEPQPAAFEKALAIDPTLQLASYLLARHVRDNQSCEEALPLFRNSVRLADRTTPAFIADFAGCLIDQDNIEEARDVVSTGLASAQSYGNQNAYKAIASVRERLDAIDNN